MKKLLSMVLVAVMLMSVLCVSVSAEDAPELTAAQKSEIKLRNADVDGDGTYSTEDVRLLLKAAAGTSADSDTYDVNSDGVTSVEDALVVLKQVSGVKPLLTDEEALELFNEKLNAVKTEKPAFDGVSKMQYNSVKITQKVKASNVIIGALISSMNYTDLEYDKYVEKMISSMEGQGDMTADKKAEIEAMRESARTYKDPVIGKRSVEENSSYGHLLYFPREKKYVSSELTTKDIKSISYSVVNGVITMTVLMNNTSYTASTYPSDIYKTTYGKVFNLVNFNADDESTLVKGEYKNGKIEIKISDDGSLLDSAEYYYDYYAEIKAPTQSMSEDSVGTITVEMTTKSTASVQETFTF